MEPERLTYLDMKEMKRGFCLITGPVRMMTNRHTPYFFLTRA